MKRKRWVIAAVVCVLIGGYTAGIYGQTDKLTKKQITEMNEKKNQEDIAKSVLQDTGRADTYDLNDLDKVAVYYGNVNGKQDQNEKDVVVSVNFGPKDTVVAAYTPNGEVYEYVGDIGNFYNVDNIQFIPVESLGKDVVVVQETANQMVGAFENSTLLRGFLYDDKTAFSSVLNTPIAIDATWNEIWNNPELKNPDNWVKVREAADAVWNTKGDAPKLNLTRYQKYLVAGDTGKQMPAESKFVQQSNRVVVEEIYWSQQWKRFIIGEAIEKKTGQPIAVLQNMNNGPYALAGLVENTYLVQKEDGSQELLPNDAFEWTQKPTETVQIRDINP
ncbi:hypothetical protein [Anaerotignum sp.]|uniref:hypothetical protein n=1 Tax=Anaerotignum sp. TaxID=2039241 RepID=UPI0028A7D23F|nr:hypothetical protein [Anaerotignum sp.]